MKISPSAYAGLDIALWDLKAKKAKLPLNELLGLPLPKSMTSLTIGIMSPQSVNERILYCLKIQQQNFLKLS
jgi:L-alanine-DL-glutamate epimerase-like enolase superfamily enzyme